MKVALFGSTGQLGRSILSALESANIETLQIISPGSQSRAKPDSQTLTTITIDLTTVTRHDLSAALTGTDAVVSALGGNDVNAQSLIQDAAWDAGVKRFYPSEFGMHHIYRRPGEASGYIHPVWNTKSQSLEKCRLHPSILSSEMTYTIIGSGDLYNQSREKTWCPWTQPPSEISSGDDDGAYHIPILGNPSAPIDFTHLDDLASFIVQTLLHPEVSTNQELNFVSDRVSFETIATLLEKYSGRKVIRDIMPLETVHRVMRDPENVPKQLGYAPEEHKSAMPVDFWFLVRGVQGEGRFLMDPGKVSNGLFPGVGVTTFEEYIRGLCT